MTELHQSECVQVGRSGHYAPPEAAVGVNLSHPHLVRAFKYATVAHPAPASPSGTLRYWVEGLDDDLVSRAFLSLQMA